MVFFRNKLFAEIAKGIPFFPLVFLGLLTALFAPIYDMYQTILQAKQDGLSYSKNSLSFFLIQLSIILVLVVGFKMKAFGVLSATVITTFCFFILAVIKLKPKIKIGFDKPLFRRSFRYCFPLIPHAFSGWIMSLMDRLFLNSMKSTSLVGIYNVGFQFGNVINTITAAVDRAYTPWFFEQITYGKDGEKRIVRFALFITVVYAFLALIISLFTIDILNIMVTVNFREGWQVVPFLSYGYVFNGIYFLVCGVLFLKRTQIVPIITFSTAMLNILLNTILIPKWGMNGAAFASMISHLAGSVLTLVVAQRLQYIPFKWIKMYGVAVCGFAISILATRIGIKSLIVIFSLKISIVLFFLLVILFVYKKETKLIYNKVHERIFRKRK